MLCPRHRQHAGSRRVAVPVCPVTSAAVSTTAICLNVWGEMGGLLWNIQKNLCPTASSPSGCWTISQAPHLPRGAQKPGRGVREEGGKE